MFLRRNVAGQTFVVPGSLRALADGAAVTAGATLTVVRDGTAGASAGTLAHVAGGAYRYTPTATETDCAILGFVLEGTGAITVCGSIRTTQADPNDAAALGLTRLDAAVSTRLAAASYTAPPTDYARNNVVPTWYAAPPSIAGLALEASVQLVRARTDTIPAGGPLAATAYVAPPAAAEVAAAIGARQPAPRNLTAVTAPTVDDCLIAAFGGAVGRETIVGTAYTLYQPNGSAVLRLFALDSATAPTART